MPCYAGAANSASTGMLVVDSVVPGSFAEGLLEPGDIITRVEGKVVTHFLALEDTLDSSVGATVTLNVERGAQPLQATIKVSLPVLPCHTLLVHVTVKERSQVLTYTWYTFSKVRKVQQGRT